MLYLTLTLFLVSMASVSGQGQVPYDWLTAPYDNDDFNVKVHYTDDSVLECNDSRVMDAEYTVNKWITPELQIINPGESFYFETLDGLAGWMASEDGFYLSINNTQDRHFGIYYCLVNDSDGIEWAVKTAINYKGAHWGDVWYRYEQATIWSIVGSVICGAIFAIGAFIWTRFDDKAEEVPPEEDDFDTILAKLGYNNDAFEPDGYAEGDKPSSDMQIQPMSTAAEPTHDAPTAVDNPTYQAVDPVTTSPARSDSPSPNNDDPPAAYDTVVEINGTAKALGTGSHGTETVGMKPLGSHDNSDLAKSIEDIRL